jgi:hypothetical protein
VVDVIVTRGVSVVAANDVEPSGRRGETPGGRDYFTSARR